MKYFSGELWRRINSGDEQTRIAAEKEWSERDLLYSKTLKEVIGFYPPAFVALHQEHHGFHDYQIHSIRSRLTSRSNDIVITLRHDTTFINITLESLQKICLTLPSLTESKLSEFSWGYDELGYQHGVYSLSVLLGFDDEMSFEFQNISASIRESLLGTQNIRDGSKPLKKSRITGTVLLC